MSPRERRSGVWRNVAGVLAAVAVATGACHERREDEAGTAPVRRARPVYVAVGASESVGVGADHPIDEAWPMVLYRTALPPETAFVNLGIPGATVADALERELPAALARRPTLVTVWLNVNDILHGVLPEVYEGELGRLVHALRRDGATRVLVANAPAPGLLPAYVACRQALGAATTVCPPAWSMAPPGQADAVVDAYNAAVAAVAGREGAVLVDLHGAGLAAQRAGTAASLISGDGFHPSTAGHRAVAAVFAQALAAAGGIDGAKTPGRRPPG